MQNAATGEKQMGIKDIAKKMAQSKAAGGGNYLKDGRGVLIVKALKHEDMYKGETFVAELLVEASEEIPGAGPCNAPGTTVSFVQQFEEYPDTAFANTKAFVYALTGEDDASVEQSAAARVARKEKPRDWTADDEYAALYEMLCSPEQPARGMRIRYETYRKTTKKSGKELVLPRWSRIDQTDEQIAEARAQLAR